ncbi:unnamed protein product [Rotaria socialis]|uniref:Dynamin-like GTPase OPA1, mitochondrial n=1 Tax=Rotaria socialis TaxID=392032 RepID=A0A818GWQ7_9BILA|nr:unnamed protein product [Rotaria socialis]CAF3498566.1 unnamed protein product [Rotaria socialis]CAF3635790.1 unnamed protein product [Rotaria socialis]CAF3799602.1 unnamed protein product [Rotaria socialis]CAF4150180.1 unnamed protein product [Rotaria socialis]
MSFLLRLLRLRYLIFGTAVGGGYAARKKYQDIKDALPDLSWMKEYVPEETVDNFTKRLADLADSISFPDTTNLQDRVKQLQETFANYLSTSSSTTSDSQNTNEEKQPISDGVFTWAKSFKDVQLKSEEQQKLSQVPQLKAREHQEKIHQEMMNIQIKYQREIDRLEKEIKSMKKQILLRQERNFSGKKHREIKRSLIDMYSDVLDELSEYDTNYNIQDHLPRVVVIGDQSSGKTSVLEMITQARIFPRGAGEMMTRSPVKVTLSEGPYHVATFKDSPKEYDLTKESDLAALRKEIELRMRASVKNGQTISSEVISLSVKGPGLQRMVLVDLPGIISTETIGMASDTKNSITRLANSYMSNPNAIILCIQDGSVDAERSNVTELVSKMDPYGKRTIFVLTKVDMAEANLHDSGRIKKILEGKLFPMKALGYFAVVTGKGNADDPIDLIQKYEEEFFQNSKLFRDGIFKANQTTTRNLSFAVSDCFWKMVKESVEQQTDTFKATKFNLETEWKNSFPKMREQDRDELFEKARGEILDEVVNLSLIPSQQWEDNLNKYLWEKMSNFIFDDVFLTAAQAESISDFNTTVDVKLQQWAEKELPRQCIDIGQFVLLDEFQNLIEREQKSRSYDPITNDIKLQVVQECRTRHQWDAKALDSLRVIQTQALQDRSVSDKQQWESAAKFMESTIRNELQHQESELNSNQNQSSWRKFMGFQQTTIEETYRKLCAKELERILISRQQFDQTTKNSYTFRSTLDFDELTTVKKNLQTQKIDVSNDYITDVWQRVYKVHFLKRNLSTCLDCRRFFYYYQKGISDQGLDCHEVVFFWRLKRMIEITSNAIRQQISNIETRRLEREVKEILDDLSTDETLKISLLKGKRVDLAEELKRVRQVQEKLEEFIVALNTEN